MKENQFAVEINRLSECNRLYPSGTISLMEPGHDTLVLATVVLTKSVSDVLFCLQLLSKK